MGHYISGIIAPISLLREFSVEKALHMPTHLYADFGFLPLSDSHLDALFPEQGGFDSEMTYLSTALRKTLEVLSEKATVAYIETAYLGGTGSQGAAAFASGQCLMESEGTEVGSLSKSVGGPISKALRLLGVVRGANDRDEFATTGLGRHRNNDDWIEAAGHAS